MFVERQAQRSSMHARHLNEQLVRVLKTIGYDVGFQKGQGQYLFDRDGARYLDLLSGFGVFAIGRNHPALRHALKSVLDSDLPNLVQLDVSTLAGVLAERLLEHTCHIWTRCFLPIPAPNRRGRDQVRARRDRPARHRLLRTPSTACPTARCR
jgi:ornithine--oxo-acid transaminase